MFAFAEEGYRGLFEHLVACILSIRTRDEVSLVAARRLFEAARRPGAGRLRAGGRDGAPLTQG